eukprot:8993716-Prorocentrum_lima.AAC.1
MALLLLCPYPPGSRRARQENEKRGTDKLEESAWLKRLLAEFSMEPLLQSKNWDKDHAGRVKAAQL